MPVQLTHKLLITIVTIILVIAASVLWVSFNFRTNVLACDTQLKNEVGITSQQLCLQPLTVEVSSKNASEFTAPVLVIKPGQSGTIQILYHISAEQVNHQGIKLNLTGADVPGILSVSTATQNRSKIGFSNGSVIFQSADWILYKYAITTSSSSAGYYAILPPFYYGVYPPLVVTSDPNKSNSSALSMWGYTGIIQSGEFIIPSTIVGVSHIQIINYTIPDIAYCPNAACVLLSRSLA